MASKKTKGLTITVLPEEIVGWEIMQSGSYKYASVGIKRSDDERMRISYEWKGDNTPDFVMSLMSFMQANKINKIVDAEEYASIKERL
jgi:hypothetical protein